MAASRPAPPATPPSAPPTAASCATGWSRWCRTRCARSRSRAARPTPGPATWCTCGSRRATPRGVRGRGCFRRGPSRPRRPRWTRMAALSPTLPASTRGSRPVADYTEPVSGGVHSTFVYTQPRFGTHVYLTDDATGSMRVIDLNDPLHPREIARWQPRAVLAGNYVHDLDVKDGLAYLAYW